MRGTDGLLQRYWSELPIYVYALVWGAICMALIASKGLDFEWVSTWLNARLFLAGAAIVLAGDAILTLLRERPASPVAHLRKRYVTRAIGRRALAGAPLLLVCIVLLPIFSKMKSLIPLFNPYSWDATFIAWDRALLFGYDAWQLLDPLFGAPAVTALMAVLYQLWLLLLYLGALFLIYAPQVDGMTRRRYFLSYVMAWTLVGGVAATWLSSVGPVFAEPLLGIDTFVPQMESLYAASRHFPIMTLPVQDMLLDRHFRNEGTLGSGITAMPSMHVAIAFLYWLAARHIGPRLSRFFFAYFVVIWIGSVHLAYHYAVDGLVSVVAVLAIWIVAGAVLRWWDRVPRPAQATLRTKTVPAE